MVVRLFLGLGLLVLGCAGARSAPELPAAHSAAKAAPIVATPLSDAGSPSTSAPLAAPALAAASSLKLELIQVLSVPVSAIALGEGTRVAALADLPYVGDVRGLHPLPLPAVLRAKAAEVDQLGIFFGRDNEPRIMGTRRGSEGESAVYWRHLRNGWRDGREEIGQLGGNARGGLWGVLGSADPELVCRSNAVCLIKRTSGWTVAPAGPAARVVNLQGGVLWGLDDSGIAGIDAHGWALALPAPAWSAPTAFWATRDEAWVSTAREIFHYADGKWVSLPSPVGVASAWWGNTVDSIWVVGSAGAAHWDGHGFRAVSGAPALRAVRGRNDADLWFAGDSGLFYATNGVGL